MTITQFEKELLNVHEDNFEEVALSIFKDQIEQVKVYCNYVNTLGISVNQITSIEQIPFLPIQFFRSHTVIAGDKAEIQTIFESSGTSNSISSRHYIKNLACYEKSFLSNFQHVFGDITQYCILGLLPSYLEKGNSSLIYMVDSLIKKSKHPSSGFYLHDHEALNRTIAGLELIKQPTILFGVTYALLDFAEKYPQPLSVVKIIETGGMKGRRVEILREQAHQLLQAAFGLKNIYAEYGMTELLSQAYSMQDGIFQTPSWMKMLVREVDDPFQISTRGKGVLNIIDLANIHSCCFIATDDIGEINDDGHFTINGRLDHSDLRGCSLLLV